MKTSFALLFALVLATGSLSFAQDKAETGEVSASGITFTYAKPWKKVPAASSMRVAQLQYDNEGDLADVDAIFFYFGERSGSVEANIQRWKGGFQGEAETKIEEKDHNGTKVTYFTGKGTFLDGPPMGQKTPKDGYTMLGAIVPGKQGAVFIKFVGPTAAVEAAKADFEKLAASPFAK